MSEVPDIQFCDGLLTEGVGTRSGAIGAWIRNFGEDSEEVEEPAR